MQLRDVYPVICLSGQGRSFWPVSRKAFPRQLSRFSNGRSPFQIFLQGSRDLRMAEPVLVAENESLFLIEEQLREIAMPSRATILEPLHRGGAASICAATELVAQKEPDALLLIILSENLRFDQESFRSALSIARGPALEGQLVLFGQHPIEEDASRDYIELLHGAADTPVAQAFTHFIQQPDPQALAAMHETNRYLWSADLVLASAKTLRAAFGRHAGSTRAAVRRSLREGNSDRGIYSLGNSFTGCDASSFTQAVLQHEEGMVVPIEQTSRNMNSWRDFWREAEQDDSGVAIKGAAVANSSRNSLLHNTAPGIQLVGLGLENIVGVVTPDAVLIADMNAVDDLPATVDQLAGLNLSQVTEMPTQTHWAGIVGATLPSVARPKRSKPPRAAGTPSAVRSCKRSAERFASGMRSTWSVRSSSRSRPASSASNRASRLDEAASLREVSPSDASSRARARASALAVRTSSAGRPELLVVLAESRVGALMVEAFPRSGALSCATVAPWLSN